MSNLTPAIEASGLTKAYTSSRQALAGVDLVVPRGTAFGLIGLNGAGKTTFVKALLGVVLPSAGQLRVLGGAPEEIAVRERIGYVPERLALPGAWSARSYLQSVSRLKQRGATTGAAQQRDIQRQLERVGLQKDAERRIGQFSKGMRQRLALAAALLGQPDLLVLDEPTDGVDPLGRAEIRELLSEERERGATLFLNSHLLSETERMCDRIGILAQGQIVREGSVAELCGAQGSWHARFAAAPAERAGSPGHAAPLGLAELGFVALPDGSFSVAADSPAELDRRLAAARERGALLIELRPAARDLESVLAEELGR
ncbi:MAG: hypothetical protein RL685_3877 [Pseudomonadota bacterium]|jgi:ABC-2 type transport system ATP-binding protein